MNLADQRC